MVFFGIGTVWTKSSITIEISRIDEKSKKYKNSCNT